MVRIAKVLILLLVVAGMVGVVIPAYSQEKTEQQLPTSVSGEIVSVDLVKSNIVVKHLKDPIAGTYENLTFSVSSETKITKGDATLKLLELKAGDKVTVDSVEDALGNVVVKGVSVEEKSKE